MLHSFDLQPLKDEELAGANPAHTLVVVFGSLRRFDELGKTSVDWARFQQEGGALLLVTDLPDEGRLAGWGVRVPGVKVVQDKKGSYQGTWPKCPLVTRGLEFPHPLFKDLKRGLATNCPSSLQRRDGPLNLLADFSDDCEPELLGMPFRDVITRVTLRSGDGYIFGPKANAPPGGRVVIIAGQGMFMNGMLVQRDNDNFAFSWNAIRWLSEGPDGPRKHALFLEDDQAVTKFALPLRKLSGVPMPPVQVINRMLHGMDKENLFNRVLIQGVGKDRIVSVLLLAASVCLLLYGGRRVMSGRFNQDTRAALLITKGDPAAESPSENASASRGILALRQEALAEAGNFREPAQALARQFFLEHAGVAPFFANEPLSIPSLEVAGNWWERRSRRDRVERLWRLCEQPPTEMVSKRRFLDMVKLIGELEADARSGRLAFKT